MTNANVRVGVWALRTVLGLALLAAGSTLASWRDEQATQYNEGIRAYRSTNFKAAIEGFDRSLRAYEHKRNWLEKLVLPTPSEMRAASAYFHKGSAHAQLKQTNEAVEALIESLRLNSGNDFSGRNLSLAQLESLAEKALFAKYNLELLFETDPKQAEKQGKNGKGKGKDKNKGKSKGKDKGEGEGEGEGDSMERSPDSTPKPQNQQPKPGKPGDDDQGSPENGGQPSNGTKPGKGKQITI